MSDCSAVLVQNPDGRHEMSGIHGKLCKVVETPLKDDNNATTRDITEEIRDKIDELSLKQLIKLPYQTCKLVRNEMDKKNGACIGLTNT